MEKRKGIYQLYYEEHDENGEVVASDFVEEGAFRREQDAKDWLAFMADRVPDPDRTWSYAHVV